ncbi:MAG: sugar ABC transporter permease [Ruminococcaceae bacterium]|nr:sugar ABC transporter permease [Oscillospiraceae bacterium]
MKKTSCEKKSSGFKNWFVDAGRDLRKNKSIYLLMVPGILFYIVFCYAPMYGVLMGFVDYSPARGILGSEWVGLKYFKEFFGGMYAWRVIRNTLVINLYSLIFVFPMGIILALMMNELRSMKFKKTIQTTTYLPHFISLVVVCGMVVDFTSSSGLITNIVNAITGKNYTNLLYEVDMYRGIYIVSSAWKNFGWNSIIYMAALSGIDMELYEAAQIDGAGKWKQLLHITIPGILPTVVTMFILQIGQMMTIGHEQTILLYNPVVYEKADVISSFVYRYGLENAQFSYSTAVGLFNSLVNVILVFAANKLSKKVTGSGIF